MSDCMSWRREKGQMKTWESREGRDAISRAEDSEAGCRERMEEEIPVPLSLLNAIAIDYCESHKTSCEIDL